MEFSEFKDVNNVKNTVKEIFTSFITEVKKLKNLNKDVFVSAFKKYFVELIKEQFGLMRSEQLKYWKFNGRTTRKQYWMFSLFSSLVSIALSIVVAILPFLSILSLAYLIVMFIMGLSLGVRRLHDINLSGWFFLIACIPLIGAILLLILFCMPSDKSSNKYGK